MAKKDFLNGYETYDTKSGFGNANKWKKAFKERMSNDEAQKIIAQDNRAPHSILNVSKNATLQEIKKAFRSLMMQWHPDRNPHRVQEAEAMSKKIIAAYTLLLSTTR